MEFMLFSSSVMQLSEAKVSSLLLMFQHTEIAEASEVSSLVRFLSFVEQVLSSTSCKLHVSTHRNSRIEQSVEFSVFFKLCRAYFRPAASNSSGEPII